MKSIYKKFIFIVQCMLVSFIIFGCNSIDKTNLVNKTKIVKEIDDKIKNLRNDIESFDVVKFGKYEIDGNAENGLEDIEWLIVEKDDEKNEVLLLSKYILDSRPYQDNNYLLRNYYPELRDACISEDIINFKLKHPEEEYIKYYDVLKDMNFDWDNTTLKIWLNDDFYNTAFDDYEKAIIATSCNTTKRYRTRDDVSRIFTTEEKIFIFDIDEYKKYFNYKNKSNSSIAYTAPTEFAKNYTSFGEGIEVKQTNSDKGYSDFWLRCSAGGQFVNTIFDHNMGLFSLRDDTNYADGQNFGIGIRPALRLSFDENICNNNYTLIKSSSEDELYRIDFQNIITKYNNSKSVKKIKEDKKKEAENPNKDYYDPFSDFHDMLPQFADNLW